MKETIAEIKTMLSNYRPNKSLVKEKKKQLECLEAMLDYNNKKPNITEREAIEGACLNASRLSHIPRSITNKFHSVTESVALMYQEELKPNRFDKNKILTEISRIKFEMDKLSDEITLIDNLIKALSDKQRFIVKTKYIEGYTTKETNILYNEKFIFDLEETGLLKSKAKALQEMAEILSRMEVVKWANVKTVTSTSAST